MATTDPVGNSDLRAPLLTGTDNYSWWKGRMETYLSKEPLVLRVVQKGSYTFLDKDGKPKDIDDLTADEVIKQGYNGKARNSIMNGLCQAEYDKVSSLKSAKEMWDALETYHEGSKSLKKVKLSNLMNNFGNFKMESGESIRDAQARFQVNINALEKLGKKIPQDEINMKVLSAVPFIFESKVTALESSPIIDTIDHLSVFAELEQFEKKIHESQNEKVKPITDKMKNLALHTHSSKLEQDAESDTESDEDLALLTNKIKRMIEKKNRMKREKGKTFVTKKETKDLKEVACYECGKKGHYKRDCYKLKNKPKQQASFKDKKKSRALITWSDDDSEESDESSDEMVNLALVGMDTDSVRGHTEELLAETDSEDDQSEVNSFTFDSNSDNIMLESLTIQEPSKVSLEEIEALKAENSKLNEKNSYLKNMVQDLMSKMDSWIESQGSTSNKDAEIKSLKEKVTQTEGLNQVIIRRNKALMEEIKELKTDIKARDDVLETFKLRESNSAEPSKTAEKSTQQAEVISQQAEKINSLQKEVTGLKKGLGSFVQGEESLRSMMKDTRSPLSREGIGFNSNKKEKSLKYDGRKGIPYNYAMPWKICRKCGKKGHLEKNCIYQADQKKKTAYWKASGQKTAYHYQSSRTERTNNHSPKVIQKWIKKSDLNVLYVLTTNQKGPKQVWVPKG